MNLLKQNKVTPEQIEFTQEDLVDILSVATYGSDWLKIVTKRELREKVREEDDCIEDVWAKLLLNGDWIACRDYNEEDEPKGYKRYQVTLDDFKKAAAEMYNNPDYSYMLNDFINDDYDQLTAGNFMQLVMFGEQVYC